MQIMVTSADIVKLHCLAFYLLKTVNLNVCRVFGFAHDRIDKEYEKECEIER